MTKVMTIIGTRPEANKMAPVIKELHSRAGEFEDDVHIVYPVHSKRLPSCA
jgi:hypothetical protein